MKKKITIGLIGFGCVGEGLYQVLHQAKLLDAEIKWIVVKDREKKRSIPQSFFSYDIDAVINDDEVNVVVELIDDSMVALEIAKKTFAKGKHFITANKKMIAENLQELILRSREENVSFLYEGAVAGSIPILRNLEEYYNNDSLSRVKGILNGTSNYILTKTGEGQTYEQALKTAQELGFAESDPTLDVHGFDAKFKSVILAKHAFGIAARPEDILNVGVVNIVPEATAYGAVKSWSIKLLGRVEKVEDRLVSFVAPHFVEETDPLHAVEDEFNAVSVKGLFADEQQFYGKGAGAYPTASAVLSDISALQFDYKYEYRKEKIGNVSTVEEQFFLKVFVGSKEEEGLDQIELLSNDEQFRSKDFAYKVGWIEFSELKKHDWFNSNLTLVVLPDPLIISESEELKNVEHINSLAI
ncbi:MAG: homoserine dehydrogenase [Crocinitomicaceae bacterium]